MQSNAKVLGDAVAILKALNELSNQADRVDICSYWAGTSPTAFTVMTACPKTRVIVGGIDFQHRAVAIAGALARTKGRVRYLEGCHVKLYVFHFDKTLGSHSVAVIASMNLGVGMPFEFGVAVSGQAAKEAGMYYNNLWQRAKEIKALDAQKVVDRLTSSTFRA